jgi:hypothetical protein
VTLSTGRFLTEFAEGTFSSAATARACGSTSLSPGDFVFEFPQDADSLDVEDVSFGTEQLLPGSSSSLFGINVSISQAAAGAHPLTALDTTNPTSGASGTAQLSISANGARNLTVDVVDKAGVAVHLKAVCDPI